MPSGAMPRLTLALAFLKATSALPLAFNTTAVNGTSGLESSTQPGASLYSTTPADTSIPPSESGLDVSKPEFGADRTQLDKSAYSPLSSLLSALPSESASDVENDGARLESRMNNPPQAPSLQDWVDWNYISQTEASNPASSGRRPELYVMVTAYRNLHPRTTYGAAETIVKDRVPTLRMAIEGKYRKDARPLTTFRPPQPPQDLAEKIAQNGLVPFGPAQSSQPAPAPQPAPNPSNQQMTAQELALLDNLRRGRDSGKSTEEMVIQMGESTAREKRMDRARAIEFVRNMVHRVISKARQLRPSAQLNPQAGPSQPRPAVQPSAPTDDDEDLYSPGKLKPRRNNQPQQPTAQDWVTWNRVLQVEFAIPPSSRSNDQVRTFLIRDFQRANPGWIYREAREQVISITRNLPLMMDGQATISHGRPYGFQPPVPPNPASLQGLVPFAGYPPPGAHVPYQPQPAFHQPQPAPYQPQPGPAAQYHNQPQPGPSTQPIQGASYQPNPPPQAGQSGPNLEFQASVTREMWDCYRSEGWDEHYATLLTIQKIHDDSRATFGDACQDEASIREEVVGELRDSGLSLQGVNFDKLYLDAE